METKITQKNFFLNTKAIFINVDKAPKELPDYTSMYYQKFRVYFNELYDYDDFEVLEECDDYYWAQSIDGEVSSMYYYTDEGVYRESEHWGEVASCSWKLLNPDDRIFKIGFCKWEDFKIKENGTNIKMKEWSNFVNN